MIWEQAWRRFKRRLALTLYRRSTAPSLAAYYIGGGRYLPASLRAELHQMVMTNAQYQPADERLPRQLYEGLFWCYLDLRIYGQRRAYLEGAWYETAINHLLQQHLPTQDVFIDIGANIGVYSLLAGKLMDDSRRVIAFEANPATFAFLQEHIALNRVSNATLYQVALGDDTGTITLQDCTAGNGRTSAVTHDTSDRACDVPLRRGDDLLVDVPPDARGICKIDVEGMEYHVVRGLQAVIATRPALWYVIEINPAWIAQTGESAQGLHDIFAAQGFVAYRIDTPDGTWQMLTHAITDEQYLALFKRPAR